MSRTALTKAYEKLSPEEQEAVRKLWRMQKQIEQEIRRMKKRNIVYRF